MPTWLVELFGRFGYVALFFGVFLENVGVPVPGETVLLAAGFLAREHVLRLAIVIPCAIVAAISGDNLGYFIGRRGGRGFVERYGKYVAFSPKRLDAVDAFYRKHGAPTIFFARFITGLRVVAAIFAGITRIPWTTFVLYNASGAVVWATTMALLGFAFGHSFHMLERWVGRTGIIIAIAVICAAVAFLLFRRRSRS